ADEGYEVREASDGQAGLEALSGWTPSAILLDLMMPQMDGWKFRELQRRLNRAVDVPLVVVSASRRITEAHLLGPAAALTKPFDLNEVVEVIDGLHHHPSRTRRKRQPPA
ncbi:MAG: response regulator, partial [Chloroflexota bacterium]|nr:response regulator [Chloroflexota bacterium]